LGETSRLQKLVEILSIQAKTDSQRWYAGHIQGSTRSLLGLKQACKLNVNRNVLETVLSDYLSHGEKHAPQIYDAILSRMTFSRAAVGLPSESELVHRDILRTLSEIGIGPRVSSELILHQLTRTRWKRLSQGWKTCFIAYGRSITALQRAKRLLNLTNHPDDLVRELQNPGHTNWDPLDFPETLLLEIENDILIRDVQERIADQMRNIHVGQNAVMQLNMGEGKSSVIVPIVAAALADGSCLVRVLVAKPQSQQMFQMLVSKLGGQLGRRVYHLPVSRSMLMKKSKAREIERICLECTKDGGVLLVQPEHILPLKLMCMESFDKGKSSRGQCLLKVLEYFRTSSRDVVDESDENFSVKFELIYTIGSQRSLEFSPQRWVIIQQVLDLFRKYAPTVKERHPKSVEVGEQVPGSFPRIRLLDENAVLELFQAIASHICQNGIDSLPIARQPEATRQAVLSYILQADVSKQEVAIVEDDSATGFWTASTEDPLLLLRGLLAGGVLEFCLRQKRWRVNYGPAHDRKPPTRLSVPYRAKDNPAPRSEFSHPDAVMLLTCLSYYYSGLADDDLMSAFQHLVKSDQADTEYDKWVADTPMLPDAYWQLRGINLQDRQYCREHIFPGVRFSKAVIDYFLANLVFPKEMKEFSDKLSASGWDIGEIKHHPTAGFSGTNDSRDTLPLSVKQLDLPEQSHTNALVLEYLLRPENSVAYVPPREKLCSSDAETLIKHVIGLNPVTRVILDVGAQILGLSNFEVAETWLR
jgi:hypothetical protein